MSFANSVLALSQSGRRFHARRRIDGLAYVDFGPDNGGILIDLGEGGLGFQSVIPVSMNQAVPLKFKLPGESNPIEGQAEVAWMNESGKGGGLRFVELSAEARTQIREWTGVLSAPEAGALQAGNGTDSNPEQESATEHAPANSMQESTAAEPSKGADVPAQISDAFAPAESAQVASPEIGPEIGEPPPADEAASEQLPVSPGALPGASSFPEFTAEVTAAADSTEPLAGQIEWAPPAAPPISAASAADIGASQSTLLRGLPQESEHIVEEAAESAADLVDGRAHLRFEESERLSNDSTDRASDMAKTTARPELTVAASAAPAKGARVPASDPRNFVPAQKHQRRPAPSKPQSSLPTASRQDSAVRGSFPRQSQKPVPASAEWENVLASQGDELKPQATLASQALKIGIGAAAGACLVLAVVAGLPILRTRVQATANATSGGSNLANSAAFQVEVADVNNRRWILRSGGEAGSPFGNTPSRRETQTAASTAARNESAKSSRSNDSDSSSDTVDTPQVKLARPAELALSRPHAAQVDEAPAAQLVAPSIFDGITPPVGSLSDRLPASGLDAPGIIQPESQPGVRKSALQSAVLVQRVAPIYPNNALGARIQGQVLVNVTIGQDGVPRDLKVIGGDPRLVAAALSAISQWRYRPATLGGQPIETQAVVTIAFDLK
jgi:TonB family protein